MGTTSLRTCLHLEQSQQHKIIARSPLRISGLFYFLGEAPGSPGAEGATIQPFYKFNNYN